MPTTRSDYDQEAARIERCVTAAVGATAQFVRYHVDNGDGFGPVSP